jgi:hypothetical protein
MKGDTMRLGDLVRTNDNLIGEVKDIMIDQNVTAGNTPVWVRVRGTDSDRIYLAWQLKVEAAIMGWQGGNDAR